MQIKISDVIGTMINFLILFFILRHFFFNKVNNMLTARSEGISNDINSARDNKEKAELLRLENEQKLKDASKEGKSIVEDFKAKAEKVSRQPEATGKITTTLILGCALAEATAIYGLLVAIMLMGKM